MDQVEARGIRPMQNAIESDMDYLVGISAEEAQQSAAGAVDQQSYVGGGASLEGGGPLAPPAPAPAAPINVSAATDPASAATVAAANDMFDLSSFDPLQLDQLTASAGLAPPAQGQAVHPSDLQAQQYYMQQPGYAAAVSAFVQPATDALQTVGQQTAGTVVSSDATSTQPYMTMLPAQVLSSAQSIPGYPATVVSTSTMGDKDDEEFAKKRPANWARMSSDDRRRWERNMREQQRSHKISAQIKELRSLLTESNVPFKPNKYSILLSVADYIKQLQARAIMLDAEHRKLIDTIRETSEMVNNGQTPEPDALPTPLEKLKEEEQGSNLSSDADMLFVQGLDYQSVFDQCIVPMGIAALDGRILACNEEFQTILGYSREELLKHSLFTVMKNHEEVYKAMGEMLKADDEAMDSDLVAGKHEEKPPLYWSGVVGQTRQNVSQANVSSRVDCAKCRSYLTNLLVAICLALS